MADAAVSVPVSGPECDRQNASRLTRLLAAPSFQKWAARFPLTRRFVRSEGAAMFDLVAGFCHSQVLYALVALDIPKALLAHELSLSVLAQQGRMPPERMAVLLSAAMALGLLKQRKSGLYALTTRGAALAGVPGLAGMIMHHDVLYRDLSDPVAFFRGEVDTELAAFWPYVFGAGAATDPANAARYSQLMADSQRLVADDTLAAVDFRGVARLMDVGGGSGAFLAAVGAAYPGLGMTLFDLPAVVPAAQDRFAAAGMADRVQIVPGSFRDQPLPRGADMISLVRVLYDHSDDTVVDLLAAAHAALPPGGRIVISEPMTGGAVPHRAGDAYFALYCMAMRTGRARSADRIATLLQLAGFSNLRLPRPARPFITSVVEGVR
ncbi:methyltransferase [Yoonia vestfoldensis]|uniref:Demethylspheroidene O-methyltransferase n=1 Tax=Yoonia vestfoldensis TaxID=245188 RepID=A0A1Y0EH30_9RHOB|nr:methyltransferase [Yoonia vestfoldensis]ARU02943.1 demethylspheroidene O-methyltransferase [Yoonia vestfoldensis]